MELRGFVAGFTSAILIVLGVVTVGPAAFADASCGAVIGMSVVRHAYHG